MRSFIEDRTQGMARGMAMGMVKDFILSKIPFFGKK